MFINSFEKKFLFESSVQHLRSLSNFVIFLLVSVPFYRGNQPHHKLVLANFQEILPPTVLRDFKLIFGLVIMDIDGELPHFSLLVIDNVHRQLKHFCSLQEKLGTS